MEGSEKKPASIAPAKAAVCTGVERLSLLRRSYPVYSAQMQVPFKVFLIALLALSIPSALAASDVIDLTAKNFDEVVFNSKVPVLLEFYAPWCGHCKKLIPTYEEVATNLKGVAIVAKIDATVEEGLAHRYGIRGFPTLKLYKPGTKGKDLQDYQGARSSSALVSFVTSALSSSSILRVKESTQDALWTQKPIDVPRVILFSAKPEPSTLYKSLSMRFASQLVFAQVQQNDPLCATYNVDTFPSVLVFLNKDSQPAKFDGKLGPEPLTEFLRSFIQPASTSSSSASSSSQESKAESTQPIRPATPAATWKQATDWSSLLEGCGKHWCVLLLNHEGDSVQELKDRMILHYGKEGKFQFVEVQESGNEVGSKFDVSDSTSQWVVFNVKRSKFAKASFEGSLPSSFMDRIVSGDAKLSPIH